MSDNDVIAQFMGIEIKMDMMGNEKPDYMTWNELMPVCEKIMTLQTNVTITNGSCKIKTWARGYDTESICENLLISTYESVLRYIKWNNRI
jgi:hypothetical protein